MEGKVGQVLTKEEEQQIGDGQTEQVVVGGRVHGGVTHNHDANDDIANDSCQEDDHVDNRHLERIRNNIRYLLLILPRHTTDTSVRAF